MNTLKSFRRVPGCLALTAAVCLPANTVNSAPDNRFKVLYTQEWSWREAQRLDEDEDQTAAHKEIRAQLPRVDAATQQARLAYWSAVIRQLDAIHRDSLRPAERTNYAIYKAQIQVLINRQKFPNTKSR